jgi:hypothetical protein
MGRVVGTPDQDGVHSTLSIATMMLSCGSEGTTERPVSSVMTRKERETLYRLSKSAFMHCQKKKKKRRRVCIHAANYEFVYVGRGTITRDHQFITALLPPAGNHTRVVLKYFLFVYTWRTAQPRAYPPRAF